MYCERYYCKMSELACVIRRRNALENAHNWKAGRQNKPGSTDINCRNCEQGRLIAEKHSKKDVEKYKKNLRNVRKKAMTSQKKEPAKMTVDLEKMKKTNDEHCDIITKLQEKASYHEQKAKEFYLAIKAVNEALAD